MQANASKQNAALSTVYQQRPAYKTVEQFSNDNRAFTPSSLRNLIFKADERLSTNGLIAGNGLLEIGAIVRVGRKVLINEDRFYQWIESQNAGGQK